MRTHNHHRPFPERPAKKTKNETDACKATDNDIHNQSPGKALLDDALIDGHAKVRSVDGVRATGAGAEGGELGLPRGTEMVRMSANALCPGMGRMPTRGRSAAYKFWAWA
jgi:hypothetical protein